MSFMPRQLPALLFLSLLSFSILADVLSGRVVKVVDGDTVYVLDVGKARHKIRLAGIDTPERGQPFGNKAKQHLLSMVGGEDVTVEWTKRDRYKRIIGKIVHNEQDVNLAMVQAGYAWWYRKYSREQSEVDQVLYEAAEDEARAERVGLWRDPAPVPPWVWRKR